MKKILIIDDEFDIAELLKIFFSSLGVDPMVCYDGKSALKAIEELDLDAVFCDYTLPDMNGAEIFREIKGRKPELAAKFILMTGLIFDDEVSALVDSERIRLLQKPFQLQDIQSLLNELKVG